MALKIIRNITDIRVSQASLHKLEKRATPEQMMKYRLALQLHRLYNQEIENEDWIDLNFQQNFNSRNDKVKIIDNTRLKIKKKLHCEQTHLCEQPY